MNPDAGNGGVIQQVGDEALGVEQAAIAVANAKLEGLRGLRRGCEQHRQGRREQRPVLFGDVVEHTSWVSEFRRSSFDVEHRLFVQGKLAVEGKETRVWATRDAADPTKIKSQPIPPEVTARFAQ